MNIWFVLLIALIAFLVGKSYGWREAHYTVAQECERLGKFFVGKKVYHCDKITVLEENK